MFTDLEWLPICAQWKKDLRAAEEQEPTAAFAQFKVLANSRMDFIRAGQLDLAVQRYLRAHGVPQSMPVIKLALIGSSTLTHLHAGIRLGGLRRGLLVDVYSGPYGMYRQEIFGLQAGLDAFQPDVLCLALDAQHVAGGTSTSDVIIEELRALWHTAKQRFGCVLIQQTILATHWPLMGNQENRFQQSPAAIVERVNHALRNCAEEDGVYLLSVDTWSAVDGVMHWFDPTLWFRSKQEVHPRASNMYGDQLGRILASLKGVSAKCLVLDLDNTLWGGVIGDDGLEGIVLGQGSTSGEAYLALQKYALQLSERGVILAVCSKNEEVNALAPFDRHTEMILKREHIACFIANWQDKATNLRIIAQRLSIGLDSLVFVDDNPAERALIRRELPMVAVPELPEDNSLYLPVLAMAGYFEALNLTDEDRARGAAYQKNIERANLQQSATDMVSFLQALQMQMICSPFTSAGLQRVVQLINKTNQFNLTTYRYTESDVREMLGDTNTVTLQIRLADTYGDNGVIALVVARHKPSRVLEIETWLMSCRVLGRSVEEATLNVLVEIARDAGCDEMVGIYRETQKNSMVREHYARLGFSKLSENESGESRWKLRLRTYVPLVTPIRVIQGDPWNTGISIAA